MFSPNCTTAVPRLYAAGEDTGGVHGANRLGGNGVANSTVFGGLAGDAMAAALKKVERLADPSPSALSAARERAFEPLGRRPGDLEAIRRKLSQVMWDDAGILRTAESLARARTTLNSLAVAVSSMGAGAKDRRYNLTWMDRLNLENLILVSQAICAAADARTDSRGAHFREDHPEVSELAASHYTVVRAKDEKLTVTTEPVHFTFVRPGQTLLTQAAE